MTDDEIAAIRARQSTVDDRQQLMWMTGNVELAAWLVNAPADIAALLDAVDHLRAENEKLRRALATRPAEPEYDYHVKLDSWTGDWYQEISPRKPQP